DGSINKVRSSISSRRLLGRSILPPEHDGSIGRNGNGVELVGRVASAGALGGSTQIEGRPAGVRQFPIPPADAYIVLVPAVPLEVQHDQVLSIAPGERRHAVFVVDMGNRDVRPG